MNQRVLYLIVILSTILMGCATNPMTGRSQLSLVSEESVINKSTSMYTSMVESYDKKGKVSSDPELNARLQKITNRLVEQAFLYRPETQKWKWQVSIIEDPVINASCMPGGKMVMYTGLMEKIQPTDDEIAQVMGHEISHALANHGAEKMSNQMLGQILVAAVTVAAASSDRSGTSYQRNQNQKTVQSASALAAAAFITLPNSREAETEADKLGIELAAQAGYDPVAAISLWNKMSESSGQKSRGDFWSTHPSPPNRIDALQKLQEPMQSIYEAKKSQYGPEYKPKATYVVMGSNPIELSSNVRVINPNETTASLSSDVSPVVSKPIAFYSPEYAAFKSGALELKCNSCGLSFMMAQSEIKKLYANQDWRGLVQKITKVNYHIDLSYLYLGFAAEGMGLTDSAKTYFNKALELSDTTDFTCSTSTVIKCHDFDIKSVVASKL